MKRRGALLASAAIGARQAGRVAPPGAPLSIVAAFAADATCMITLEGARFVLPDTADRFVAALGVVPDKARAVTLVVQGGDAASARHVGAILELVRSAGFDRLSVVKDA